jgi:hypothetical protein
MTIVMVSSPRSDPNFRKESEFMAKRASFVPESPDASSLEGRVVLSTFGEIGNWFSSQYHEVTNDLGITHKHTNDAASGIEKLWKESAKVGKPAHAAHTANVPLVTSNDTIK